MRNKLAAVLVALAAVVPAAVTADPGGIPPWFTAFLADFNAQMQQIAARLQGVEQQTAQNTAAIAQNAAAIGQNAAATAQNSAAITQNTNAIAQNAANTALNTADIARNTLDIASNTASITALQAVTQVYRRADYAGTNVTTSVFSSVGGGSCGNSEIQTRTRVPQPDGSTQLTVDVVKRSGAVACQHLVTSYRIDERAQYLTRQDALNVNDPSIVINTTVPDVPIQVRPAEMRVGTSWGSASRTVQTNVATGVQNIAFATSISTLTAVDSVTVPAGTFSDCLRLVEVRNSAQIGNFTQYDWFCRDVGLVKRIQEQATAPLGFQLELQSFN